MSARPGRVLYTPEILSLAMSLAEFPLNEGFDLRAEATSRVCGSRVLIGLVQDDAGRIERAGARVTACAIGQASSALFLHHCHGIDRAGIAGSFEAIENWLSGTKMRPEWPGIGILDAARDHPGRHGAILLPWKAALAALSKHPSAD